MKPTILQGHTRPIKSIKLSLDGMHIFSASLDRTINCWDIQKKVCVKSFTHYAAINCFYLSKCGKILISGDNTGTIYIWDIEKVQIMITLEGNPVEIINSVFLNSTNEVLLVTFSGRGKNSPSFLKCYAFKFLMNIHSKNEKEINDKIKLESEENTGNNDKIDSQSIYDLNSPFNNDKKNKKKDVKIDKTIETKLKLHEIKELCKFDSLNSKFVHAVYVENDKYILSIKENGFIELLNSVTGKVLVDKQVHEDIILDMDVNETMRYILTASRDGFCNLISLDTFDYIHKFNPTNPTRNINCCRLMEIDNPFYNHQKVDLDQLFIDEKIKTDDNDKFKNLRSNVKLRLALFSGGQDSKLVTNTHKEEGGFEILAYELETGVRLLNIESHFGPVTALGCLPYNQTLISGSEDSSVRTYEIYDYIKSLEN